MKLHWLICASLICLIAATTDVSAQGTYTFQPDFEARVSNVLHVDGLKFKDLNKNGELDAYEDWRESVDHRAADLLRQMTIQEKVGMMMINTLNAGEGGVLTDLAVRFIEEEKMTRFIFRNTVTASTAPATGGGFRGVEVTPYDAAQFMNSVQELSEATRLGIPALFKSNARNHYEHDARAGINVASGSFSAWPKEAGLAATRDMELIGEFAQIMAKEWTAIGLRSMYGYMADLATEPRWYRVHETFTEDADLASDIIATLVKNLQGEELGSRSVALTLKHFPGGGPQEGGGDPHYEFGKNQAYPAGNFDYHVKPFIAAINAGVSSIMPYYGIPVGQPYVPNDVGMAFSKGIVTGLLRDKLGFKGYVNSDTGIIGGRAWGLEGKSVEEQILVSIDAGTDVFSGFNTNKQILDLVTSGQLSESRVDESVQRLLTEQFKLGLFENPYVDPNRAGYLVGNRAFQKKAELAQRKSIVLLQNRDRVLPLPMPASKRAEKNLPPGVLPQQNATTSGSDREIVRLYTMGMNPDVAGSDEWNGFTVVSGDYDPEKGESRPAIPAETDFAIIRVAVSNAGARREMFFGGANPEELDFLAFSDMARAESWKITPSLEDIQDVMKAVGEEKTILAIRFRQPYVLDEASGLRNAGAILATFGVSDAALMDILTGKIEPSGKLPYALAGSKQAIAEQDPDAPGYSEVGTLFPFGHGLNY